MKKKVTLEDLAAMTERGFEDLRAHMATKEELSGVKEELRETREVLARAIEDLATKLSSYVALIREEYNRLSGRIHELEERVSLLESGRRRRPA